MNTPLTKERLNELRDTLRGLPTMLTMADTATLLTLIDQALSAHRSSPAQEPAVSGPTAELVRLLKNCKTLLQNVYEGRIDATLSQIDDAISALTQIGQPSGELLQRAQLIMERAQSWFSIQAVAHPQLSAKATSIRDSMVAWLAASKETT